MKTSKLFHLAVTLSLVLLAVEVSSADPVGTVWTYQGELKDNGALANGDFDLEMKLFDMDIGGTQQNGTVSLDDVPVVDGRFTVNLDFGGGVFDGDERWLEIGVRAGALTDPNLFVTLTPRRELTLNTGHRTGGP